MERAERLYRQGEYDGSWLEIEELQPIERVMPEPVDLRLRICTATGHWSIGKNLASVMEFADQQEFRITAAEFYHAYAVYLCGKGEIERAKFYVEAAVGLFPAIRQEMVENPALAGYFGLGARGLHHRAQMCTISLNGLRLREPDGRSA